MKYDFITIGGATEDIYFYTNEGVLIDNKKDLTKQKLLAFEYGAKVKIDKAFSSFGGGAANIAVSFSRFGFKVACLVSVGKDLRGDMVIKNLKKEKVDTSLIQKAKNIGTGFSFHLVGPSNEHIVFSNRAANDELRITRQPCFATRSGQANYPLRRSSSEASELRILGSTKWIYMTSLSGKWLEVLNKVFSIDKVKIAWNPGHRQILTGVKVLGKYLAKTSVLIVNKDEAIELVLSDKKYKNKSKLFINNIKNLLVALRGWGPKMVVITSGKDGADAFDGKKFYHQGIIKEKKRVNTVGVGDAFGSSFIAGLELFKGGIKKAMRLGARNTASVISQVGAQNGLLRRKDILSS